MAGPVSASKIPEPRGRRALPSLLTKNDQQDAKVASRPTCRMSRALKGLQERRTEHYPGNDPPVAFRCDDARRVGTAQPRERAIFCPSHRADVISTNWCGGVAAESLGAGHTHYLDGWGLGPGTYRDSHSQIGEGRAPDRCGCGGRAVTKTRRLDSRRCRPEACSTLTAHVCCTLQMY
jgi:hypothetical protein